MAVFTAIGAGLAYAAGATVAGSALLGVAAGAAAGLAVGATVKSAQAQKQSAEYAGQAAQTAQQQYAAEQKRAEVQNIRSVRAAVRQTRLGQAAMINQAALSGGMGGSALSGGLSSMGSQLTGNLGYMKEVADLNTQIGGLAATYSGQMAQASISGSKAAMYGSIGSLGTTIFSTAVPRMAVA